MGSRNAYIAAAFLHGSLKSIVKKMKATQTNENATGVGSATSVKVGLLVGSAICRWMAIDENADC